MPSFWDKFEPRRTVRGGIKAQSKGGFGKSWWAARWISVLESFDIGGRLQRGRSYARIGQVLSIEIKEGAVEASVQGSRKEPYRVKITVKTIPDKQWIKLSKTALSQAIVAAKLLAGEMPEDMETLFSEAGISLFPERKDDLQTECSCPDRSNPCKHIAAVYYLIGEAFDRDPFLIFRLRGMGKENLIQMLVGETVESSSSKKKGAAQKKRASKEKAKIESAEPLPNQAEAFWSTEIRPDFEVAPAKIPTSSATLPKRLGPLPFWRGEDNFLRTIEDVYRKASKATRDVLLDEDDKS